VVGHRKDPVVLFDLAKANFKPTAKAMALMGRPPPPRTIRAATNTPMGTFARLNYSIGDLMKLAGKPQNIFRDISTLRRDARTKAFLGGLWQRFASAADPVADHKIVIEGFSIAQSRWPQGSHLASTLLARVPKVVVCGSVNYDAGNCFVSFDHRDCTGIGGKWPCYAFTNAPKIGLMARVFKLYKILVCIRTSARAGPHPQNV
jgi:hypothetical protein